MVGIYSRTVQIYRTEQTAVQTNVATVGQVGYQGRLGDASSTVLDDETPTFSDIPATIKLKRVGRARGQTLPSDAMTSSIWVVEMPGWALPLYSLRDDDLIVDDEGYRYIISSNYWTILGYQVECVRLEM